MGRWPRSRLPITKVWNKCASCPYRFLCEAYDKPLCMLRGGGNGAKG